MLVPADPGICRQARRLIKEDPLQLAKSRFGKLAPPVLARPKCKQLAAIPAHLAVQAAFEKEDVVVRVAIPAIWSIPAILPRHSRVRKPPAACAQPTAVWIKRSGSRSKDEGGICLPW